MCMYMFLCMCRYSFVKINVFLLCAWIKCMNQNTINLLTKEKCYHYDFIFFSVTAFIFVTLSIWDTVNNLIKFVLWHWSVFIICDLFVINKQIKIHVTKYLDHCQIDMFRILKNIQSRLFYSEIVIISYGGPFYWWLITCKYTFKPSDHKCNSFNLLWIIHFALILTQSVIKQTIISGRH